jgi:hypothetical protein
MLNSILTVKIIEGREFSRSGAIVVVLSVEGQRAQTEPVSVTG